jgi:hypothetical protein
VVSHRDWTRPSGLKTIAGPAEVSFNSGEHLMRSTTLMRPVIVALAFVGFGCGSGTSTGNSGGPFPGVVRDGTGPDIDTQTSTTTISANWSGFTTGADPIVDYEWAIGTTKEGTDVQDWRSVGVTDRATNDSLALQFASSYFVSVRAMDAAGRKSPPAVSNGVRVHTKQFAAVLSQFGITWSFDQPYEFGQFANGDYWVVGPVTITSITPPCVSGPRIRNGAMINPPGHAYDQGYDNTMYGQYDNGYYKTALNVALNVSPSSPLVLKPGASLVSSISNDGPGQEPQLRSVAVLTCLAADAPAGSFRPPYAGTDKTVRFNKSQLNYSLLSRLAPVGNPQPLATIAASFERPWLDCVHSWMAQFQHPSDNMPFYGREISTEIGKAALALHMDFTDQQKETLLIRFVQLGVDYYGVVQAGGQRVWQPNGGHGSGRKWPILFAGLMLGDTAMASIGGQNVWFGEDGQTFYVAYTAPNVINFGYGGYTAQDIGMAEWGFSHAVDPSSDTRSWTANPYRQCCTANAWAGFVLAARIMGQRTAWNHDALFDYMDRYMRTETNANWRQWEPWVAAMWDQYRSSY